MPASAVVKLGARGSELSRAQVKEVLEALKKIDPSIIFAPQWIQTTGDRDLTTSLRTLDKSDFFTKEIDELLLKGKCRIAVHSAKDLPDPLPEGLELIALTEGLDSADSLVIREGEQLEAGATVGTSCLRRELAVKRLHPNVQCVDIRGTIERRFQQLDDKKVDGVVIAECALIRLGLTHRTRIHLPGETAPLQGQLAILARCEDEEMKKLFAKLDVRQKKILYLGLDPEQFKGAGKLTHYPVIRIVSRPYDPAFQDLREYTHFLFTSKTAVQLFFQRADKAQLAHKIWIAIGKVTALYLERAGYLPQWIAEEETQEGIIQLLQGQDLEKAHFFVPRSALSRPALAEFFTSRGVRHYFCDLYDTVAQKLLPIPDLNLFDEIIFTSSSTVQAFFQIYSSLPSAIKLTPIGPITQKALRRATRKTIGRI